MSEVRAHRFAERPRAPFQFTPHLERFSIPGMPVPHLYIPDRRAFRVAVRVGDAIAGASIVVEGEPWEPVLSGEIYAPSRSAAEEAVQAVLSMVRADFDYERFLEAVRSLDERLYKLAAKYLGLRPGRCTSLYAALADSIVKQRVSLRAGLRIYSRLVERYGCRVEAGGATYYWHPCPEALASQDPEDLRRVGLTRVKARALVEVARAELEGRLPSVAEAVRDPWGVARELTRIYGVGEWTAQLAVAMVSPGFPLGPLSDLAVARGLRAAVGCVDCQRLARRLVEEIPEYAGLILYLAAYEYEELGRRGKSAG